MSTLRHVGIGRDRLGYPGEILEDPVSGARFIAYSPETHERRVRDHEIRIEAVREEARSRRRCQVRTLHAENPKTTAAD